MSKTKLSILLPVLSVFATQLAGCNTPAPSKGDLMIRQGGPFIEAGIKWNEGNRLVKDGNKRIAEGRDTINEGKKIIAQGKLQVKDGQNMIEQGKKLLEEGERLYQTGRPQESAYPSYPAPQPTESIKVFPLSD